MGKRRGRLTWRRQTYQSLGRRLGWCRCSTRNRTQSQRLSDWRPRRRARRQSGRLPGTVLRRRWGQWQGERRCRDAWWIVNRGLRWEGRCSVRKVSWLGWSVCSWLFCGVRVLSKKGDDSSTYSFAQLPIFLKKHCLQCGTPGSSPVMRRPTPRICIGQPGFSRRRSSHAAFILPLSCAILSAKESPFLRCCARWCWDEFPGLAWQLKSTIRHYDSLMRDQWIEPTSGMRLKTPSWTTDQERLLLTNKALTRRINSRH